MAVLGTAQEADTAQLPQSISPVELSVKQGAWTWGNNAEGKTEATRRAPCPW